MRLSIGISDLPTSPGLTGGLPEWVRVTDRGVTVEGDPVLRRHTHVHVAKDRVIVGTHLEEVTDEMQGAGIPVVPSPRGVSHTLTNAFAPLTLTNIEGVSNLAAGDAVIATHRDGRFSVEESNDFPWIPSRSAQDRAPSTRTLRDLLAEATDRQLASVSGDTSLMLSSGKDSVGLAMALADSGHTEVRAITHKAGDSDTEHEYAAALCARLGIRHEVVTLPDDPALMRTTLTRFFEEAPQPSADLTTIPYAFITQQYMSPGGGVMDGSGNDTYMGFLSRWKSRLKANLRVRPRVLSRTVRQRLPLDSGVNYFTRSRVASLLPLRMFRTHDIFAFYPDAVDTEDYWYREGEKDNGDLVDFLAATVLRQDDPCRISPKIHMAARVAGLETVMPWCDQAIADYYFNLPEADRFDREAKLNKVLLRRALAEALDYDERVVGSHYFDFDPARFMVANAPFVREEVLGCALWGPEVEPMFERWFAALPNRPLHAHALHGLFMVSGWHNHSRHLTR